MGIRLANAADLPALVALDSVAGIDAGRIAEITDWTMGGVCFVLEVGDRPQAYAVRTPSFFHRPFIEMVMVGAPWRRQGHGSALIRHLCDGLPEIWTSTNQSNQPMQHLLQRLGFRRSGLIDGLDAGDPELIYRRATSLVEYPDV